MIEAVKQKVKEAIRLFKESVRLNDMALEDEVLKTIDEFLADVGEQPIRISGKSTWQEDVWYWGNEARRGLTTDPGNPVLAHLETLLRYLEAWKTEEGE